MKWQRPLAVIIDDAQHLGKVSGGWQLQNQVDCLKSLAEITETVHVLIGTYELLSLHNVSAQLIGRSFFIHFPRYGSTDEEIFQFKAVLSMIQDLLPFEEKTDVLLKHWEFCYERSLGCVGNLHRMLVRAVHSALWAGEKTLSEQYLERHALSEADCYLMMLEIYEGERECSFSPGRAELRKMLGLTPQIAFNQLIPEASRGSTIRVKERKPARDVME